MYDNQLNLIGGLVYQTKEKTDIYQESVNIYMLYFMLLYANQSIVGYKPHSFARIGIVTRVYN